MKAFMRMWRMDIRIRPYVIRAGFYGVYCLGNIMIDWPLITCLVERWRPETHTFHLPVGEMTITLQDVAIILGLRIDGPAVTGTCVFDVAELCEELLGVTPPADALRGSAISIRWLCDQLSTPAPDADEVALERSARGFILALMGSFLFADKKGGVHVHLCFLPLLRDLTHTATYSWGGAVLAHTYRELCRASLDRRRGISGCIILIQVCNIFFLLHTHSYTQHIIRLLTLYLFYIQLWSWERLHVGRPDFRRSAVYPAPPVPHALHDADANVVDGDLAEALDDGLPVEPVVEPVVEPEPEPALPLGCRWRVPLTRVHNPSGVLLYRDQLDAQTLDQVMIYVKVYGSIIISFIFT